MIEDIFSAAKKYKDEKNLLVALRLIEQIVEANTPDYFEHAHFKALVLYDLEKLDEAEQLLENLINIASNEAELIQAMINLGNIYFDKKKTSKSIEIFKRILDLEPKNNAALNNLGNIHNYLGLYDLSVNFYNQVIDNDPTYSKAYNNKGNVLRNLRKLHESIQCYEKAIEIDPNYAVAYCNMGNALTDISDHQRAIESFSLAIKIDPDFTQAYNNRGNAHLHSAQYKDAISDYKKTLDLDPDFPYTRGLLIFCKQKICDWDQIEDEISILVKQIKLNKQVSLPFPLISIIDDPKIQKLATELCFSEDVKPQEKTIQTHQKSQKKKINIAYYSSDYSIHPTTHLLAEIFELHNKEYFKVFVFSIGPPINDEMRMRVINASDIFVDAHQKSDLEIAELSRELEIDIAVDLKGHTYNSRPGIFSHRCAPIQINFLGYPGTAGTRYHDYILSDENVIPTKLTKFYSEKIIYMPNSYLCYDRKKPKRENSFTRQELGLPENSIVFACFNNNYKITKDIFGAWMTILKSNKNSVLWLFEDNIFAQENLKSMTSQCGIDPARVIFAKPMNLVDHLDRHNCADIFLDTYPCNAHTTSMDALWMGLPIITLYGNSYASRVAMSLLNSLGLKKYATKSLDEYIKMAIELSNNQLERNNIKSHILDENNRSKIFDSFNFTKYLELAYINCLKNHNIGITENINLNQVYPFITQRPKV